MRCRIKTILLSLLFFTIPLSADENQPNDQLLVIFGSSGYVIYKVLDFANDHGFRYIKILSYEFDAFQHKISGSLSENTSSEGRYFELKDRNIKISFLCFTQKPDDPLIIDLEKYRSLLDDVAQANQT